MVSLKTKAATMTRDIAYDWAEKKIESARRSEAKELDLHSMKLTELPESIGLLTQLLELNLGADYLTGEKK
jgi:hypothetical protein